MTTLLEALLDTERKQHAYLTDVAYHQAVDLLVLCIPEVLDVAAHGALRDERARRAQIDALAEGGDPWARLFTGKPVPLADLSRSDGIWSRFVHEQSRSS